MRSQHTRDANNSQEPITALAQGGAPSGPRNWRQVRLSGAGVALTVTLVAALIAGAFYIGLRIGEQQTTSRRPPLATTTQTAIAGAITQYTLPAPGYRPIHITTGPDGALWFSEDLSDHIGRLTPGGHFSQFTIPGLLTSHNEVGPMISGPDGAVWFTEIPATIGRDIPTTAKIGRITPQGQVKEFSLTAPGSDANGITVGPDGNIWFADMGGANGRIGRITPQGQITEFAVPPAKPGGGGPKSAYGITTGSDGALWFTEYYGSRIGRMTVSGKITEYTLPIPGSSPASITNGPDGALWFTEGPGARRIGRITTSGVITEYPMPTTDAAAPGVITHGPDGALWFTTAVNPDNEGNIGVNEIGRLTPDGRFTTYPIPTATRDSFAGDITVGPDSALWFTEFRDETIGRISL